MNIIFLTPADLSIAAILIIALALLSVHLQLGFALQIIIAGIRTTVQLLLVGFILKAVFEHIHIAWLILIAGVMLISAGREVMNRQKRRFKGWWGFGMGTLSMFISSFFITFLALNVIIDIKPWYEPQYAIPLLGMMLGNTMNGISIGLDRLTQTVWEQRTVIEARLMIGHEWTKAIEAIRRESIRSGLIPIMNSMAVAGIVSIPGMMTGQILGGSIPLVAIKYQIAIMLSIFYTEYFSTILAIVFSLKVGFNELDVLNQDIFIES